MSQKSLILKTENERMVEGRIRLHRKLVSESGPVAHSGAYYNYHYCHYWFNQICMQFLRLYRTSQKVSWQWSVKRHFAPLSIMNY